MITLFHDSLCHSRDAESPSYKFLAVSMPLTASMKVI